METDQDALPTHYALMGQLRYSERLHFLHMRYWSRVRMFLTFLLLISGTGAFATMFAQHSVNGVSTTGAWLGFAIAVLSILNHTLAPADKFAAHKSAYRAYKTIHADAFECSPAKLCERLRNVEKDEAPEIEALAMVACNDTYRATGHDDLVEPETRMQKFMRILA